MNKISVSRDVEGISLNGQEYLLNEKGDVRLFSNVLQAINFLKEVGETDDTIQYYNFNEEEVK